MPPLEPHALIAGDEAAFERFVTARYASLLRIANCGGAPEHAEQLVRDALGDFCSTLDASVPGLSLEGLLFRCLVRRVRQRARDLGAPDPFAADEKCAPAVPRERFRGDDHRWSGGWIEPPRPFALESAVPATLAQVQRALARSLDGLPARLRAAAILRDVQGLALQEICQILEISDSALRDALNRGRARVRAALEAQLLSPSVRVQEAQP